MLNAPDVFTEEDIIDELLDFMIAGTQTVQNNTQFTVSHLAVNPESKARIRAEFRKAASERMGKPLAEDTELSLDTIKSLLDIEFC